MVLMAHPSKRKGDQGERDAVAWLSENAGSLCNVSKPQTTKAAGIPEDVGDLWFFREVSIQVKVYKADAMPRALRDAAVGASQQASNGGRPICVGMVKVPLARAGAVQWLAVSLERDWVGPEPVATFKMASKAVEWIKDDTGPEGYLVHDRQARVCRLVAGGSEVLVISPMQAWLAGYAKHPKRASSGDGW